MTRMMRTRDMNDDQLKSELVATVVALLLEEDPGKLLQLHRRHDRLYVALQVRGRIPSRASGCQCEQCFEGF